MMQLLHRDTLPCFSSASPSHTDTARISNSTCPERVTSGTDKTTTRTFHDIVQFNTVSSQQMADASLRTANFASFVL
ncbi:hypothetical protein [Burkholderia anthina]|uniref:hypothetical protein n=1 Tax=Burkholderia anthina TaxID=179879 RepID=UPI0015883C82